LRVIHAKSPKPTAKNTYSIAYKYSERDTASSHEICKLIHASSANGGSVDEIKSAAEVEPRSCRNSTAGMMAPMVKALAMSVRPIPCPRGKHFLRHMATCTSSSMAQHRQPSMSRNHGKAFRFHSHSRRR